MRSYVAISKASLAFLLLCFFGPASSAWTTVFQDDRVGAVSIDESTVRQQNDILQYQSKRGNRIYNVTADCTKSRRRETLATAKPRNTPLTETAKFSWMQAELQAACKLAAARTSIEAQGNNADQVRKEAESESGASASPLCPPNSVVSGSGMMTATAYPEPVLRGAVMLIDSLSPPKLSRVPDLELVMKDVSYTAEMTSSGIVLPESVTFSSMSVNGKEIALRQKALTDGCIDTIQYGKVFLSFVLRISDSTPLLIVSSKQLALIRP